MVRRIIFLALLIGSLKPTTAQSPYWGHLANPNLEGESVKATMFFSGNWRNGIQFYDFNPTSNTGLYTMHPADARHLGWSESQANRDYAINQMIEAGVNLVSFSYWGLPGTDNWAYWAPMQTSTASHDELFNAVLGTDLVLAPYIESYAATDNYEVFSFMDDFPGTSGDPAPKLTAQIEDLVNRYLVNPLNSQWPDHWARLYDKNGDERYLISIIHVASNQAGITDQEFADGFDRVANLVYDNTGIHVGFALDILPPASYAGGSFKATPLGTGSCLSSQASILAIQCFIPEIWQGSSNEYELIRWKADYTNDWLETGIPWIHDLNSGYDASIIFPTSPVYGNDRRWRFFQDSLLAEIEPAGLSFNPWNGYTEGMAAVPTLQHGDSTYKWLCGLFGGNCNEPLPEDLLPDIRQEVKLKLYPNPANEYIKIEVLSPLQTPQTIRIFAPDGRILLEQNVGGLPNELEISLRGIPPGIYLVSISTYPSKSTIPREYFRQAVCITP
ncbi:MAG: T9SS type A sorting domain-containing protein [Bacteroidales bacterium]|nr:T9SS type A sorting domain-containing protein [Bacteroidales bacterium]